MTRIAGIALVLLLSACGEAPPPAPPAPEPAGAGADGTAAPAGAPGADATTGEPTIAFALDTLDHGRFDLAAERGRWVVVNFWATWCTPCLKEIPDLTAFAARREDVRVIGLAYEDIEPEAMRAFLEEHPAGYPIAIVDVYATPEGIQPPRGLPTTWLVAPDGAVARRFLGPVTSEELEAAIAAHEAAA
ncbi:TlpA family protein disulfide reductase [Coralloluteibacterium thermophilus]|uniref:TlpA family protein disulfide reductase n=1 Tax=Coralloluteibacterium thermophilum TaxID=2707049 RepID=A0ABV9NL51_9GAMM